jgi:superfamily I DNA/RNA helicase
VALAYGALNAGSRLFAVGDDRQSIYGFTGALENAMQSFADLNTDTKRLTLNTSFRCPRGTEELVRHIVPAFRCHESNPDGRVRDLAVDHGLQELALDLRPMPDSQGNAILCRRNAPLLSLWYRAIGQGIRVRFKGRDLGRGLVRLVRAQQAENIGELKERLMAWSEELCSEYLKADNSEKAETVRDQVACILIVADALGAEARGVEDLVDRLEHLFEDALDEGEQTGTDLLTLSTVHRAKGFEFARVGLLAPELLDDPRHPRESENLTYVSMTRHSRELIRLR